MGKSNTLAAMMAGAAMAGGLMYLKKLNETQPKPAPGSVDEELSDLKRDNTEAASWHATYTIDGEEVSPEELKSRFKEETAKAVDKFRADAKVASDEILTGLKKAMVDVKAAVEGARKAAADRRAAAEADVVDAEEFTCCCEKKEAAHCCEEVKEEIKEAAEDFADKAEDVFADIKEAVEEAAEDVKDHFEG